MGRLDSPIRKCGNRKWLRCGNKAKLDQGMLGRKGPEGLPEASRGEYERAKTALTERFKPASKRELYNTELQVQNKRQEG